MKRLLLALLLATLSLTANAQQPIGLIVGGTPVVGGSTGNCLTITSGTLSAASCGGGVTTFSGGTTGLTPSSPTTGDIVLGGIMIGDNGGTGVANIGKTITLGGNLTTSGANPVTFTTAGSTNVTLPASGTLAILGANSFTGNQTHASGTTINWNSDTILLRDAANVLALQNSTNPQALRLYNTFTDASNYERGGLTWSGNALVLNTSNLGTGTARGITLSAASGTVSVTSLLNASSGGFWSGGPYLGAGNNTNAVHVNNAGPLTLSSGFTLCWSATSDSNGVCSASIVWGAAGVLSTSSILSPAGTVQYLGTTGGTATAYTVSPTPAITALTTGACYFVKFNAANSGTTPTLQVNSTAATTIVKRASTALAANDITANAIGQVCYDGTNFELLNPVVN